MTIRENRAADTIARVRKKYLLYEIGTVVLGCMTVVAVRTFLFGNGDCGSIVVTDLRLFLFVGSMAFYTFICRVIARVFFVQKIKALEKAHRICHMANNADWKVRDKICSKFLTSQIEEGGG